MYTFCMRYKQSCSNGLRYLRCELAGFATLQSHYRINLQLTLNRVNGREWPTARRVASRKLAGCLTGIIPCLSRSFHRLCAYIFATATQEPEEGLNAIACLLLHDIADADQFLYRPPDSARNS
jgi:hypothetical protein